MPLMSQLNKLIKLKSEYLGIAVVKSFIDFCFVGSKGTNWGKLGIIDIRFHPPFAPYVVIFIVASRETKNYDILMNNSAFQVADSRG